MAYDSPVHRPGRRALQSIPPRVVPAIVEFACGDLAREPHRVGNPLERELSGLFGARRGPYRLLYRIDDEGERVYIIHSTIAPTSTARDKSNQVAPARTPQTVVVSGAMTGPGPAGGAMTASGSATGTTRLSPMTWLP